MPDSPRHMQMNTGLVKIEAILFLKDIVSNFVFSTSLKFGFSILASAYKMSLLIRLRVDFLSTSKFSLVSGMIEFSKRCAYSAESSI